MLKDGRRCPAEHAREDGHVGVERGVGSERHGCRCRRDGRGAVLEFGADFASAQGEEAIEDLLELGVSERGDQDSDNVDRVGPDCESDERGKSAKDSRWQKEEENSPVIEAYSKICSTAMSKSLGERWLKTTAVAFCTMLLTASSVLPPVRRLFPPCSGSASNSMRILRE